MLKTAEREELSRLRRENRQLHREREGLLDFRPPCYLTTEPMPPAQPEAYASAKKDGHGAQAAEQFDKASEGV